MLLPVESRPADYFTGELRHLFDSLAPDPQRTILEIGCGDGAGGLYAKSTGKCGRYVGIELDPGAARSAARRLDEVHNVDVERFDPPFAPAAFDMLIASEVLEHLVDPWSVIETYRRHLKSGGRVYASSPNIAHRSTLSMLVNGDWRLASDGRMDRGHLRWFTPKSFRAMFEDAGYEVLSLRPLVPPGPKAAIFNRLTGDRLSHLFISQMVIEARVPGGQGRE